MWPVLTYGHICSQSLLDITVHPFPRIHDCSSACSKTAACTWYVQ